MVGDQFGPRMRRASVQELHRRFSAVTGAGKGEASVVFDSVAAENAWVRQSQVCPVEDDEPQQQILGA